MATPVHGFFCFLVSLAIASFSGMGCGADISRSPCGPDQAMVARVIDGDTIKLADGQRVRYLMIDTPEITEGHEECYGQEAKEFNSQLVMDQQVSLGYDKECTDQYNRLLAYVEVQEREVNTLMVERGYACVLYIPPNGYDRLDEFKALEAQAKADGRGMWSACDEVAFER